MSAFLLSLAAGFQAASPAGEAPALVLQITVDQLRADALAAADPRWGPDGFAWLLGHGRDYAEARYRHAATFTASGHATLATGASPARHGMVGNVWVDPEGRTVYCVEDPEHPVLGSPLGPRSGRSPRLLQAGTLADRILEAGGRAWSVAWKDRSAILLAGHRGQALWFDPSAGGFTTSTWYRKELPAWLQAMNREERAALPGAWDLLLSADRYRAPDDRPFERDHRPLGRTFPHALGEGERRLLTVAYTPFADAWTVDLALAVLQEEGLGQGTATDFLAVGLSATDFIGHTFGPDSRESEDQLLRLDQQLARLLAGVDACVGLDRTLVLLSADHGSDLPPEARKAGEGQASPGRLDPRRLLDTANRAVQETLGGGRELPPLFRQFWNPCLWIDPAALEASGLDRVAVQEAAARALLREPGIHSVWTGAALARGEAGEGPLADWILASWMPGRSGDLFLVQEPHWFLYPNPEAHASTHGSPWEEDRHVPLIFAHGGWVGRRLQRPAAPRDLVPTVCAFLGLRPPEEAEGRILPEVLERAGPAAGVH